jgi:hypothetical protein
MSGENRPRVFLSYSSADEGLAEQVRNGLEKRGLNVWSDVMVKPGQIWGDVIATALKQADAFVFLAGSEQPQRTWAMFELGQAVASGKPIIPALATHDADLPAVLRSFQYVDLSDPSSVEREVGRIAAAIEHPTRHPEGGGGIRLAEEANAALERKRVLQERHVSARLASTVRWQVSAAVVALSVTAAVIALTGGGSAGDVLTGVIAGVSAVLASAIGFYFGKEAEEDHD